MIANTAHILGIELLAAAQGIEFLRPLRIGDRALPGGEVDLRGRRRREHEPAGSDAHACDVTRVQRAVVVEVRDMVRRVSRRREALEADDLVADHPDVLGRYGDELAPEPVERVAVQSSSARLESCGIDEVRRTDLRDVHRQVAVLADQRAGGAGMVEVDV